MLRHSHVKASEQESAAQDISASTSADCHPGAKAGGEAPVAASQCPGNAVAARRTVVVIGAAAAAARAQAWFFHRNLGTIRSTRRAETIRWSERPATGANEYPAASRAYVADYEPPHEVQVLD